MIDLVLNGVLAVTGLTALTLVVMKNRWGNVVGLISQPFWFIVAWRTKSFGICILSIAYTIVWIVGIYMWFLKRREDAKIYL